LELHKNIATPTARFQNLIGLPSDNGMAGENFATFCRRDYNHSGKSDWQAKWRSNERGILDAALDFAAVTGIAGGPSLQ